MTKSAASPLGDKPSTNHVNVNTNNDAKETEQKPSDADSQDAHVRKPCRFYFTERQVDITRPDNYASRGFGFLLNTGLSNDELSASNSELILLVRANDLINDDRQSMCTLTIGEHTYLRRPFTYENFAQIVVVEPGLQNEYQTGLALFSYSN